MKNAEWLIQNGISLKNVYRFDGDSIDKDSIRYYDMKDGRFHEVYKGVRLGESDKSSILTWLDLEYTGPQILDYVEHQYLSAVVKPFRKRVMFVRKDWHNGINGRYEQIVIRVKSVMPDSIADIELPFFKPGTMYKGMRMHEEYTMKELGL